MTGWGRRRLERWLARFDPDSSDAAGVDHVHTETQWPCSPPRTLGVARASYLWLPPETVLWVRQQEDEPAKGLPRVEVTEPLGHRGHGRPSRNRVWRRGRHSSRASEFRSVAESGCRNTSLPRSAGVGLHGRPSRHDPQPGRPSNRDTSGPVRQTEVLQQTSLAGVRVWDVLPVAESELNSTHKLRS